MTFEPRPNAPARRPRTRQCSTRLSAQPRLALRGEARSRGLGLQRGAAAVYPAFLTGVFVDACFDAESIVVCVKFCQRVMERAGIPLFDRGGRSLRPDLGFSESRAQAPPRLAERPPPQARGLDGASTALALRGPE